MEVEPETVEVVQMERVTDYPEGQAASGEGRDPSQTAAKWFSGVGNALGVGLFLAGSAALGGIAMVLWNRRVLTEMRSASPAKPEQYTLFDD